MNDNNNLLKRAYEMLSIPAVVSAILLVVAFIAAIYLTVVGLEDSNGGGWLLFSVILLAFVFFPSILGGVLQVLFYIMGLRTYKKENVGKAKTYGMISAISGIVGNANLAFFFLDKEAYQKYQSIDIFMIFVSVAFIIYGLIIVGIFIKAKNKDNDMDEMFIDEK